ncbi:MAG: hypothetical protein RMJ16_10320 [Thermoguttaceae bacterium]|nr:hypothetical protein [Thermoguttaceae bacterium]
MDYPPFERILSREQWAALEQLIPPPSKQGRPWTTRQLMLAAIFSVLLTIC